LLSFGIGLQTSAVEISEIIFANITGTSATNVAVDIRCSDHVPCTNIVLKNLSLRSLSDHKKAAKFSCWEVYGFVLGVNNPMSCALRPKFHANKPSPHFSPVPEPPPTSST
jgi:galacturan 1,4-alpha-galacturonidase